MTIDGHASTVFGLYRDGTELRAVYPGKMEVLEAACASLSRRCDYPILLGKYCAGDDSGRQLIFMTFYPYIGNDPLYGGTGLLRRA